jgi:alpha-galactosidase/6-phospho-beta-glucosidase family protein
VFDEDSTWNRLFSPTLEEFIIEKTSGSNLTREEVEALNMYLYKQHSILPNQYHHFYEHGETLIYPEHLADLITIDNMYHKRVEKEQHKEKGKQDAKHNNPLKQGFGSAANSGSLGSNFYGRKYVYRNK